MIPWLGAKTLFGLSRGIWIAVVAGLIGIAVLWWVAAEKADDAANREIGATIQREGDLRETISRTEKANEAAETVRRDPGAARDECLRNARNPDDC